MTLKSTYVGAIRSARTVADRTGLLRTLETGAGRNRLWLRSLFAIYDLDDMVRLGLPWWTFGAIDAVERFLAERPRPRVFEYGSGASTVWLARRAASVVSVEHDADWARVVAPHLEACPNVRLETVPPAASRAPATPSARAGWQGHDFSAYAGAIEGFDDAYDLVVIDGRARAACLARARDRLGEGGRILFDDTERARYRGAIADSGLDARDHKGRKPGLPYPSTTTLLSERDRRRGP